MKTRVTPSLSGAWPNFERIGVCSAMNAADGAQRPHILSSMGNGDYLPHATNFMPDAPERHAQCDKLTQFAVIFRVPGGLWLSVGLAVALPTNLRLRILHRRSLSLCCLSMFQF
ncbi:hypothetical protein BCAR13_680042 [Paraburkholderia caribensis]|nr:hypothetical protein BCAR13_680042 [Paraburkholderia caribensis]